MKLLQRIRLCYYALTKRHYVAFFYDKGKVVKYGYRGVMDSESQSDFYFMTSCMKVWNKLSKSNQRVR